MGQIKVKEKEVRGIPATQTIYFKRPTIYSNLSGKKFTDKFLPEDKPSWADFRAKMLKQPNVGLRNTADDKQTLSIPESSPLSTLTTVGSWQRPAENKPWLWGWMGTSPNRYVYIFEKSYNLLAFPWQKFVVNRLNITDTIYKEVTSGKGGVTGVLLTEPECKKYALFDNSYGYGLNNVNPKGCIKSGNQVRYSTGDPSFKHGCSTANICIEKPIPVLPTTSPAAQEMTQESSTNETPVTNNIQAPTEPKWQDSSLTKEYKLPNGNLVRPGDGVCPNGCKMPLYDNKDCANEILNGKEYKNCPWIKDGLNNVDCTKCGAILMQKINMDMQELDQVYLIMQV